MESQKGVQIAILVLFPFLLWSQEITDEDCWNPFKQPHDRSMHWYGSGDVNDDGIVNQADYDAMVAGTSNDMGDVDGDGSLSTASDQSILFEFVNGTREYLPGWWNQLQTREERLAWMDLMLATDQTDTITYRCPNGCDDFETRFVQANFATQLCLNFYGYSADSWYDWVPQKYDTTGLGRFNLPLYLTRISEYEYIEYPPADSIDPVYELLSRVMINAILVGDDPLDLDDWYMIKAQSDSSGVTYQTGVRRFYFEGLRGFTPVGWYPPPAHDFGPETGVGPDLVRVETHDGTYKSRTYLDDQVVQARPDFIRDLPDACPPELSIFYPQDSTYTHHIRRIEYFVYDLHPSSTISFYPRVFDWGADITGIKSKRGTNIWTLKASDLIGNETQTTVTFYVDTVESDPPVMEIRYPYQNWAYGTPVTKMNVYLNDDSPADSLRYSLDGGESWRCVPWQVGRYHDLIIDGLSASQGDHTWIVFAEDTCNNYASDTVVFHVDTTIPLTIDESIAPVTYLLEPAFPNPFNAVVTFGYSIPKTEHVILEIYDVQGHLVATLVNEREEYGHHSKRWIANHASSGIYLYHLRAGEYSATGKCVLLK
ncbi:T9SS type A sorting domain-containing protein [Candidatus Neomarinimicrobiota bacterium]